MERAVNSRTDIDFKWKVHCMYMNQNIIMDIRFDECISACIIYQTSQIIKVMCDYELLYKITL